MNRVNERDGKGELWEMRKVLVTVTFNFSELCKTEEYYKIIAKSFIVIFRSSKDKEDV